jgi:arsenate reductase (thioredoxin)
MKRVLVVGTDNACHSQMMASLIKHISFNRIHVESAGIKPKKINAGAVNTMLEIGVDISKQKSKSLNEFIHTKFDVIITMSKPARDKVNSLMLSSTKIHKEFDDPRTIKSTFERENAFRELREEMTEWLNEFIVRHRLV